MIMANSLTLAAAHARPVTGARVLGSIALGRGPIGDIAVDSAGATVVATNCGDDSISVLDAGLLRAPAVVPVAGEPLAVGLAGGRAFVAASAPTYDFLAAIDVRSKRFLASLPVEMNLTSVAARHDGRRLFVGGTGDHDTVKLARIEVESGRVEAVEVAGAESTVEAVHVSASGRLVYMATSDASAGSLTVIDAATARMVATVPTVSPVRDVVVRTDGRIAYALGCDPHYGGIVETIDITARRALASAWIGGHPIQFALGAGGTRLYVVYRDAIAVVCLITNEILDTIAVEAQPSCVATTLDGARLYVADYSGRITAFEIASPSLGDVVDVETVALPQARELQAV